MNSFTRSPGYAARHEFVVVSLVLLFAGCATAGGGGDGDDYLPGASYHQIMGGIAQERSKYLVAAQEYLHAAEQSNDPEVARHATENAYEYGFDEIALRCAKRWAKLEPDNPVVYSYLGRLYFRLGDLNNSFSSYGRALGPVEERVDDDYLILAGDLAAEQEPERALQLLQRFTEDNPDTPGAWLAQANTAVQAGRADVALASAGRAAALAPDWERTEVALARAMLVSGDVDGALGQMGGLLQRSPGLPYELEYVRLLAAADEAPSAIERLDDLADQYDDQPEIIRLHGIISLQIDDKDAAWSDFSQLLATGYNVNECFYYLGRISFAQQRYLQAVRLHGRIMTGAYLVPAQLAIARSYTLLGDLETALNHLQEFSNNYPKYTFDVLQTQARLLIQMGRQDEALETYDLALVYRPNSEILLLARGSLYEQMDLLDDAIADFQRARQVAPDNALVLNALGYTLANRTKRYREAYKYIKRALELDPENPAIIDSMGWVLFRRGRTDDALAYLEQAYSMTTDPEISAHLGEVLWVTGNEAAARQIWTDALEEFPDSPVLNETMSRFAS